MKSFNSFAIYLKIIISNKYWDFSDFSLKNLAKVILKYIKINKYTIKLKKNKLLSYNINLDPNLKNLY